MQVLAPSFFVCACLRVASLINLQKVLQDSLCADSIFNTQVARGQGPQIAKPPSYWPVYDVQALPNLMKKYQPDVSSTSKSHDDVTESLSPRISSSRIRRK